MHDQRGDHDRAAARPSAEPTSSARQPAPTLQPGYDTTSAHEQDVRRRFHKTGYRLHRSRWHPDRYMIFDRERDVVAAGADFTLTLADVEAWLALRLEQGRAEEA